MYPFSVILVPIKELKEGLAKWTEKVAKGATIQVTKYNRPYVEISPVQSRGVWIGDAIRTPLGFSPLKNATKGVFLDYLLEDREDD